MSDTMWWREWEALLLILLVLVAYFLRAGDLGVRGEESRRAQVAFEMLQRGDWIVPREQGDLFLSRPPMQNWLIALSTELLGRRDLWGIRLPSLLATLLTTLLVYGYARTFLPRLGSLSAGLAFATFAEMFTTGCQAETEAVFIFFVSGALLLWHWGWQRGWPDTVMWTVGYGLAALGALTKGPQPPVYFVAAAWSFLLLNGQGRRLLRPGHVIGALVGVLIVAAWQIPYLLEVGWQNNARLWAGDTAMRFSDTAWATIFKHLAVYPLEILGCTLPWSPLLFFLLSPAFRRRMREQTPQAGFVILCLAIAFPTCWLPPGSVSRYFSPLYPCLAVLIGTVLQTCADAGLPALLAAYWRRYWTFLAGLAALTGVGLTALGFVGGQTSLADWALPFPWALAYGLSALGLALVIARGRLAPRPAQVRQGVLALAGFMVVVCTGYRTDALQRRSQQFAEPFARIMEQVPAGERLVSLKHVSHLFAYHYGKFIPPHAWPEKASDVQAGVHYFCFDAPGNSRPNLPFAWEEVGAVSLDRLRHDPPRQVVVIGRRLDGHSEQAQAAPPE